MQEKLLKILVADDEEDTLIVLKDDLEEQGYQVFTALDGNEALRLLHAERPEILVLDLKMPGVDGERILSKIAEENFVPGIKVFVLTGFNDFDVTKERIRMKFGAIVAGYLEKPIDIDQFNSVIAEHVEREKGER